MVGIADGRGVMEGVIISVADGVEVVEGVIVGVEVDINDKDAEGEENMHIEEQLLNMLVESPIPILV
jgi:hypothetical protein